VLTHRFLISFISTICIYLVLGLFFFYASAITVGTEIKPKEQIISFSLSSYEPEIIPPIDIEEEVVEEVIEPKPIVEKIEPEEPIVEKIIPEVLPKPIVEKMIPKPISVVKKKVVKKKKSKKKIVKKKKQIKKVRKKNTKRKVKKSSPAKKNAFLVKIRGKINKNKTYPRIAQRRGMQGSVKVSFTILPNGHVSNIRISGKKVFYKSARMAIQKAFPISTKNVPLLLPTTVNLTLRYQLK